ncbi:MAG TPA: hypothetical protein VIV40_35475 [Kofleriaceae bacterium]
MADAKPKSSKRDLWFKFGRFITGVTIACFFLPFFGVSCEGMDVINFSGADMVGGCKPGGLIADAEEQKGKERAGGGAMSDGDIKIDNVNREPLAIVALGLALVVAGLSWVRSRGAMIGALALSVACIGALAGLYVKVGGDMDKAISAELGKKNMGSTMMKDTKVESGSRFGLWLTVGGLLSVAVLTGLALKEKEGALPVAQALPPPGGYPPG